GTPQPMVARHPDNEAIMPRRILMSRAYQLADEPESEARMQLSGSRGEASQNTRSGLIGSAFSIARASITFHHAATPFSIDSRQLRSVLRCSNGINSRNVAAESPTRLISIG